METGEQNVSGAANDWFRGRTTIPTIVLEKRTLFGQPLKQGFPNCGPRTAGSPREGGPKRRKNLFRVEKVHSFPPKRKQSL